MIRTIVLASSMLLAAFSFAEADQATLEDIVTQYEAFAEAGSPEAEARARDTSPRRWGTVTPDFIASRAAEAEDMLQVLGTIEQTRGTPDAAILEALLQSAVDQHTFDTARIPLNGDWGFFSEPYFASYSLRLSTVEDAESWIDRVNDVPRYFDENIVNMQRGMATGWTAYRDPLETSIDQVREQITDNPAESALYAPFNTLPDDMDVETRERLQTEGLAAVFRANAAAQNLLAFLETEYTPAARSQPGIGSLDGGKAAYAAAIRHHTAGAGYSPEQIHTLGQSEVARIRADMEQVLIDVNFEGDFEAFTTFLRTDPSFYAKTPEDLLEKASEMSKRLDGILPRYFRTLPRLPYTVEAVPAAIAPGYTTGRYSGGDQDSGKPGKYLVNTYRLNQRPLYELPALSAHEAVPGHHLQIALAQELQDVPEFRKTYYATAFGEGWGLYAEKLAGEAGFYRNPYERFGQLSYEMWRACRLVADTGLHWYGWSREKAETCFVENTALAPLNIETEVTRYIGWPGQATAYKIGELKILELRQRAKDAMGEKFDIRDFHEIILGEGSMPLTAMENRIDDWIEEFTVEGP